MIQVKPILLVRFPSSVKATQLQAITKAFDRNKVNDEYHIFCTTDAKDDVDRMEFSVHDIAGTNASTIDELQRKLMELIKIGMA